MDKKILLTTLAVLGIATTGIGTASLIADKSADISYANRNTPNTSYSMVLNSTNQLENDGTGNFYSLTNLNNRIYFETDGSVVLNPENAWISLVDGGTLHNPTVFNTSKIKGMKSIQITSNYDKLRFHYGCEIDGEIVYSNYVEFNTTNVNYAFAEGYEPTYFKIEAYTGSGANILENVTINYSCSESSYVPTEGLTYVVVDNKVRITGFEYPKDANMDDLVIPSVIEGKPVTEIGDDAFNGPAHSTIFGFKSITIPDSVTYIGKRAFQDCPAVTKINMPSSGVELGDDAFLYCGSMETINVGKNQTEIDLDAYRASPVLTTINVEAGNPNYYSINGMLFAYDYSDDIVSHKNTLLYCPCAKTGTITIPNVDGNGDDIEYIAKDAFRNSKASLIHIGSKIEAISEDFKGCSSLSTFEVEAGNTHYSSVNDMLCEGSVVVAYPRGRSSASITIPDTISEVAAHVFDGVDSLTTVGIMGETKIGTEAFANMSELQTVSLSNVIDIQSGAFKNDSKLINVTLNDVLKTLPAEVFMGCTALSSISLPQNTLETIGNKAFKGCSSLPSFPLTSLSKVTSIGEEAFMNCTSLTGSLVIPGTVTTLKRAAFRNTAITDFTLNSSINIIADELFYDCDSLTFITIPSYVEEVGDSAFYDCDGIYRIDIEDGVETIKRQAFAGCHVNYQFIPSSVTTIEAFAFYFYDVVRIFTPYNFVKYEGQGKNGLPSTWSVYFTGYNYDTVEGVAIINGDYSRSDFMDDRNKSGW